MEDLRVQIEYDDYDSGRGTDDHGAAYVVVAPDLTIGKVFRTEKGDAWSFFFRLDERRYDDQMQDEEYEPLEVWRSIEDAPADVQQLLRLLPDWISSSRTNCRMRIFGRVTELAEICGFEDFMQYY